LSLVWKDLEQALLESRRAPLAVGLGVLLVHPGASPGVVMGCEAKPEFLFKGVLDEGCPLGVVTTGAQTVVSVDPPRRCGGRVFRG
jgi:hypothetical protein